MTAGAPAVMTVAASASVRLPLENRIESLLWCLAAMCLARVRSVKRKYAHAVAAR
jgi:hypothetical protein